MGENIEEVVTNLGSPVTLVLGMSPSPHVPSGTEPQETMTVPSTDINEDGKVDKSDLLLGSHRAWRNFAHKSTGC